MCARCFVFFSLPFFHFFSLNSRYVNWFLLLASHDLFLSPSQKNGTEFCDTKIHLRLHSCRWTKEHTILQTHTQIILCAHAHSIHECVHFISSSTSLVKCTFQLNDARKNTIVLTATTATNENSFGPCTVFVFFYWKSNALSLKFFSVSFLRKFLSIVFFSAFVCAAAATAATSVVARFLFLSS